MSEIWKLSATEMAAAIARREITSREAVQSALDRISATEDVSNAFARIERDALTRADAADAAIMRGGELGPLHGVPIAIKENQDLKGTPTTSGIGQWANNAAASETAPPVQRCIDAGAVIVGATRMPPLGFRWTTESEEFGPTRNPWDPTVTAGASSGGSGVAVANGSVPLALANDIGGSIRYPAANNGVMGMRPTAGRVPMWYTTLPGLGMPLAWEQFFVEGPIARTAEDLRLALSVLEKYDPRDPIAVPAPVNRRTVGRPRIGVVRSVGESPFVTASTPDVDANLARVAEELRVQGHDVVEVDVPELGEAAELWWQIALTELDVTGTGELMDAAGGEGISKFWHNMIALLDQHYGPIGPRQIFEGLARRSAVRRALAERMEELPILITPSSGEPPFPLGGDNQSLERTNELMAHQWVNLAVPILGIPAVSVGTTVVPGGAPLGVQVLGRSFSDHDAIDIAEDVRRALPVETPINPTVPSGTVISLV